MGHYTPLLLRVQYLCMLFVILSQQRFVSFPTFIYPCSCYCAFLKLLLFKPFLTGTTKYSRLILCNTCPSPRISHFFMDPGSFYRTIVLENNIRAVGMLLLQDQLTAEKCMCIYIYEYSFLCIIICIYITLKVSFILISPILIHCHMDQSNLLLFICNR